MTSAWATRARRWTLAIESLVALAMAIGCASPADLGYWADDVDPPLPVDAGAGGADASGGAGGLGGDDSGASGSGSAADAAAPTLDASNVAPEDAQVTPPSPDAGAPSLPDGGTTCELDGGVILPDEITIAPAATMHFADAALLPAGRYRVSYAAGSTRSAAGRCTAPCRH